MKKLIYIIILTFLTVNVAIGGNLVIDANKQELDLQNNQINLEGNVKVKMDDMTLIGPRAVGKINPKTTLRYSEASILPRKASAVFQSLSSIFNSFDFVAMFHCHLSSFFINSHF